MPQTGHPGPGYGSALWPVYHGKAKCLHFRQLTRDTQVHIDLPGKTFLGHVFGYPVLDGDQHDVGQVPKLNGIQPPWPGFLRTP